MLAQPKELKKKIIFYILKFLGGKKMVNKSIFRVQRLRRTFFCTDVSGCKSQKNKGDPNLMTQNKNIWTILWDPNQNI